MDDARTDRQSPGWRDQSRYDRLLPLDLAGWAWEALLRRPGGGGLGRLDAGRLLRLSPPIRLIETDADASALAWGWRFP
jgi:hypothetical protein